MGEALKIVVLRVVPSLVTGNCDGVVLSVARFSADGCCSFGAGKPLAVVPLSVVVVSKLVEFPLAVAVAFGKLLVLGVGEVF